MRYLRFVLLLNQLDSVMIGFGLSDSEGRFRVEDIEPGKYLLHASFLGYLDEFQKIVIGNQGGKTNVGEIIMKEGQMKLDEVIITADHVLIRIKKDTIEYNAAAFKVGPNAVVEELLKKLPSVEVEKDGSIKAQGEQVEKVLVEGKEFFGNDPTIATKNLPADAVDKVQVFDKKSEMAEFSGIDDGMEEKTINLALKENRKKKSIDWLVGTTVTHNARRYSESDHLDQDFFSHNYFADVSKEFGEKWYFKSSFDYTLYPEESFGAATDLVIWKASLSKNFLKKNRGQLTLSVVDILDQNKGISRSTNLNYFQDERILSLGRYAMLSFGYSFSGFGKNDNVFEISHRRR